MKRALILCLFLLLFKTSAECAATFFPPLQPIGGANAIQNYSSNVTTLADPFVNPPNTNYPDINQIEQSLFNRTFANQNISARLSRIEKNLFNTTYPNSTNTQRIDNIISNFNQINKYPNISKDALSGMESKVFNQSFPQNNPERRIERLEQQVFGAVQSGNLASRYESLKTAVKVYNSNGYPYSQNPIAASGWKGITGNLGNSLWGGTMTGFTPPITPYYNNYGSANYNNPYASLGSGGSGIYRGYGTNNGLGRYSYHDNFTNYGSGTGVTILD